jgi:4-alpha-glucanotransferase
VQEPALRHLHCSRAEHGMSGPRPASRRAGILVPLFSIPSSRSWGIGEIPDIECMARWLESAGQRLLQLLPINEMPPGERSPYSALSAMAIDPQFIAVADLEDFEAIGGEHALEPQWRATLDAARLTARVDYAAVRTLKQEVLRRAFTHFRDVEWAAGTRRASAFRTYIAEQSWWLDDYALFRALHAQHAERAWTEWPASLRSREPGALAAARTQLADDILYRQYLQWVAGDQWGSARDRAGTVALFGDLPFMVSSDSADVWARQDEFRLDASVGVPPDAFSETGQDWGLPVYRWDVLRQRDFDWLRNRARRNADLYDGYRVDHLVGFYRTYFRPHDGSMPAFTPPDEPSQLALGERVLEVFREPGAEIIAEDLGIVPDFVRGSLARLAVPGYRVLRWERQWHQPGQPFKDPQDYPPAAVATSGTHDTEPMVIWWENAPRDEKEAVLAVPSVRERLHPDDRERLLDAPGLPHPVREVLLEALYASGADILILPVQDVFGWRDRINQPATVGDDNWTWRLPWPCDRLNAEPQALAVAAQLREWSQRHRR